MAILVFNLYFLFFTCDILPWWSWRCQSSPGRPWQEKKRLKMEAEQQKKLEEEAKMRVATLCLELLLMVQKSG